MTATAIARQRQLRGKKIRRQSFQNESVAIDELELGRRRGDDEYHGYIETCKRRDEEKTE